MHITMSDRNAKKITDTLDYSVDDDATAGVNLAGFPILGLLVPVLGSTPTITVEITIDGTNWYALKQSDGSTAAVSITGGAAAFFLGSDELTQLAAYVAQLRDVAAADQVLVRLKLSAAQAADRVFTWICLA